MVWSGRRRPWPTRGRDGRSSTPAAARARPRGRRRATRLTTANRTSRLAASGAAPPEWPHERFVDTPGSAGSITRSGESPDRVRLAPAARRRAAGTPSSGRTGAAGRCRPAAPTTATFPSASPTNSAGSLQSAKPTVVMPAWPAAPAQPWSATTRSGGASPRSARSASIAAHRHRGVGVVELAPVADDRDVAARSGRAGRPCRTGSSTGSRSRRPASGQSLPPRAAPPRPPGGRRAAPPGWPVASSTRDRSRAARARCSAIRSRPSRVRSGSIRSAPRRCEVSGRDADLRRPSARARRRGSTGRTAPARTSPWASGSRAARTSAGCPRGWCRRRRRSGSRTRCSRSAARSGALTGAAARRGRWPGRPRAGWRAPRGRRRRPGRSRRTSRRHAGWAPSVIRAGRRQAVPLRDVLAPALGHRRLRRDRPAGRLGEQVGPGPRHDLRELVATPAGGEPPSAGVPVGQLVQRGVRRALAVDGEPQVRQRVQDVAVAAVLGHQHLRRELLEQRRHDGVERPQPGAVAGARWQRDVDREALGAGAAGVLREAGAGEQVAAALVQGDRSAPAARPRTPARRRRRGGRRRRRTRPARRPAPAARRSRRPGRCRRRSPRRHRASRGAGRRRR